MAKKLILIVEDEKVLGEMYKDKFEEAGYLADWVSSSEEALEYLREKRPDLILLDILLPREGGIGFLRKLKDVGLAKDVPVVAFSNYDAPGIKKEALELGAKAYLMKTQFTPKELLEEIKKYF